MLHFKPMNQSLHWLVKDLGNLQYDT
jgi:hypothetical protein